MRGEQTMVNELRLKLLGGLQITRDEVPLTGFVSSKAQALLCYLAVVSGPHTRAELAGLLWAEMPDALAAGNLRKALSNLKQLAGPYLTITRQAVSFDHESPHWLDVDDFESRLQAGPPDQEQASWREAAALYRGEFLNGFYVRDAAAFEAWMLSERQRLKDLAVLTLQRLSAHFAARRDYAASLEYTSRVLLLEPWREEAHRQRMHLLAQSGQRSAALAQYTRCRQILQAELGVEPMLETTALFERIRKAAEAAPHNLLPAATPIVGREHELEQIAQLLDRADCRLLSLVGLSGIGKTRLALEAAWTQTKCFANGVFWVPLGPLQSAEFVIPTIAEALGVPLLAGEDPLNQLLHFLAEKQLLLVLDSFENVLDSAPFVADILSQTHGIKAIVTTTQPLNLQGEWLQPVGGLRVPRAQPDDVPLEGYSAVQLFLQRTQRLGQPARLSEAEKRCVAHICRLVEGMPLAIELAAAWVRAVPACEIALEIEHNRDFLVTMLRDLPERHRSLRAVFDYCWRMLALTERETFIRLAVFRDGFERTAAERVADASWPALSALVDQSLLTRDAAGRYHIHNFLRQFAEERLVQRQLEELIRNRHLDFYLRLAEEADSQLHGPDQIGWLDRLEAEHDNLRAALEWALQAEPMGRTVITAVALRLAGSLGLFWDLRGHFSEGRHWLDKALGVDTPSGAGRQWKAARSQALYWAGQLAKWQGHYQRAAELAHANLKLCQELGDQWGLAYALYLAGSVANKQNDLAGARTLVYESQRLFRQVEGRWGLAHALGALGNIAKAQGDNAQARAWWEESYQLYHEIGDRRGLARTLNRLWHWPYQDGDYALAATLLQEAEALFRDLNHRDGVAIILRHLGLVAQAQGDAVQARMLYDESRTIFEELADRDDLAYATWYLGRLELIEGNLELAKTLLEQSRALAQAIGIKGLIARVLQTLASVARQQEHYDSAWQLLEESLALGLEAGDQEIVIDALNERAVLEAAMGQPVQAARLFGAAEAMREAWGVPMPFASRAQYEQNLASVRTQLGGPVFDSMWAEGRAMPVAQAIDSVAATRPAA
jgi:predicted ATPase/DNA-binding SARP family transcriptional activator